MPWDAAAWIPEFLTALAVEAEDALDLLFAMERAWFAARAAVAGRRRTSRAAAAVDILAAAPLVSATSLAAGLGMAVKNAAALLDAFCAAGIAVEVTHRVEAAAVRAHRPGAAARGRAPALPARPDTRARPAAARPAGRSGRQRGVAAAGGPADPDRSPAVRLQRPRPLDGADGSGHPARAAHIERIGTADPDGRRIVQRAVGHVRARRACR